MSSNSSSSLKILNVDPCIEENGYDHSTSKYEVMNREGAEAKLVVRRGQKFSLKLNLNRSYQPNEDEISILFSLDNSEIPSSTQDKTCMVAPLLNIRGEFDGEFRTTLDSVDKNSIKIQVESSADVLIGKWTVKVATERNILGTDKIENSIQFYMLFNPWCIDDDVYIDGSDRQQEYVLEDAGLIWGGTHNQMQPSLWKYSQFDKSIIDCALYLITEVAELDTNARGDAVLTARALSAAVNSNDDHGVIIGNWSDNYEGGTPPTQWVGSLEILKEYYEKKAPVKFGQCWVYAGVLTTVCRTLGIPCRPVTNFDSAHDCQANLTIDEYIDDEGKKVDELNKDSIWNFHVWNEVWMRRLDLNVSYDGWQAIDATPQEDSDEISRCGPASIVAVKRGEVTTPFDVKFIFAEVNADRLLWKYRGPSEPPKLLRKDVLSIGKNISTKAIGKWEREDITHQYKDPELSIEERDSVRNALRHVGKSYGEYIVNREFSDVIFKLKVRDILIGTPFSVVLSMVNQNKEKDYYISIILRVEAEQYNGKSYKDVKSVKINKLLQPGAQHEATLDVLWEEYGSLLLNNTAFHIVSLATVNYVAFEYYSQQDLHMVKPNLSIKINPEAVVENKAFTMTASFVNPLPVPLTEGEFVVQGPGLRREERIALTDNVEPNSEASCSILMLPKIKGPENIVVKFHSKELDDVDGHLSVYVQESL